MPRTPDSPDLPGLRMQRRCSRKWHAGTLYLWDCRGGAPIEPGPNGERWAIEWRAGEARRHQWFPTVRIVEEAFRTLATPRGKDSWHFFSEPAAQSVAQTELPPATARAANRASNNGSTLGETFRRRFTDEQIATWIEELCGATQSIYAMGTLVAEVPDWSAREKGLRLLVAHRDGLPVARKEEIIRKETTDAQIMANLATKPGYRKALADYIASLEARQRERFNELDQAKGRVVDETPTTSET